LQKIIRAKKVSKRLSKKELENIHNSIISSLECARSNLKNAVMDALYVIEVNTKEDDVEKVVDLLIQHLEKYAHELFAFTYSVDKKIH
jgi:hypothetical protein